MANVDDLTFTNAPLDTLGAIPLTTYSGSLNVDYDSGLVTGTLQVAPAAGIDLTTYSNFTLTPGAGNTYTITGTGQTARLINSTIQIEYSGNAPVTVDTQYYAAGIEVASATNGPVSSTAVCFVSGTLIRTARGDVPVEQLAVGDLAITSSGEGRPIRWIGHRRIDCRKHTRPAAIMPIRIAAHAFGERRPARDLLLSPGHAICVDLVGEMLIPAHVLINGTTVVQVEVDEIVYWHVELDRHDVLMADGLGAESYVEMGNRSFFVEAKAVRLNTCPDAPLSTHAEFCRPYVADGPLVRFVRDRMRAIAVSLGWSLSDRALGDLHIVADGTILRPACDGLTARFMLTSEAADVWLVSGTNAPAYLSESADMRALGVDVRRIVIDDGLTVHRDIAMDDPLLCVGFYALEERDGPKRWTAGRARLPAALWDGCHGAFFLRIELAGPAMPQWIAPVPQPHPLDHEQIPERIAA